MRALIVDDEPHAVETVAELLAGEPDVEVVGAFHAAAEALARGPLLEPDVAFVDMQMPDIDGLTLARRLRDRTRGMSIVFVTAHERFAVDAFEVAAADYVLKPVQAWRFRAAVERVRVRRGAVCRSELRPLLYPQRIVIRDTQRTTLVDVADIDWVGAAGNYSRLHVTGGSHLLREPIMHLARRLDESRFVRIHRGTIVNVDRIVTIESTFRREHVVTLRNGTRLNVAASRTPALEHVLSDREPGD